MIDSKKYYDDRMYLMHICKCRTLEQEGLEVTTLYHEDAPKGFHWAVAIFENAELYRIYDVVHHSNEKEANQFFVFNAPMVPRVSLGAMQPEEKIDFAEYSSWVTENKLDEYNYLTVFGLTEKGSNPSENLYRELSKR